MTKEIARTLLIQIFNTYSNIITANYKDGVIQEAFEMAIEALCKTESQKAIKDLQEYYGIKQEPTLSEMV